MIKFKLIISLFITSLFFLTACSPAGPEPITIDLTAEDINWGENQLDIQVGQEVTIKIINQGVLDHNLTIESLGIDIDVKAGISETITFTVDEAGDLEFICNVPGHVDAGMVGVLTVNP